MAEEMGLSDAGVEQFLRALLKVLDNRMTLGRSLAFGDLSWRQIIEKISKEAIRIEDDETYDRQSRELEWIGYSGANAQTIGLAEERLNLKLPEDYRSFLEVTNGIRQFPLNNPALLPVTQIENLKNVFEPYFFDIIVEYHMGDGDLKTNSENLSNAILICQYPDEQLVWLMPEDKERSKWQAWFYAHWLPGVRIYPSFRFYMKEQLAQMEGFTR